MLDTKTPGKPSTATEDGRNEKITLSKGRISIYQPGGTDLSRISQIQERR
jgi:hypothetical protein